MVMSNLKPLDLSDRRKSSLTVHTHLRELILNGTLPPGAILSQLELSRTLGVSRTPVREAFRMLQEEGLIEAELNLRAHVSKFDANDLDGVYASRIMIEALGIAITAARFSDDDRATAASALQQMSDAIDEGNFQVWQQAHRTFHETLSGHGGDELLHLVQTQAARGDRYLRFYQLRHSSTWWQEGAEPEHRAMFQACVQHRADEAVKLLACHLARTALSILAEIAPEHEATALKTAMQLVTGLGASQQSLEILSLLLNGVART